jgi:hypothetical protein
MLWNWPTLQPDVRSARRKRSRGERPPSMQAEPIERHTGCSLDSEFDDGAASVTWQ